MNHELFEEAKKRFPPGSIIYPVMFNEDNKSAYHLNKPAIIRESFYWAAGSDCPANHSSNGPVALYNHGLWAIFYLSPEIY